MNKLGQKGCGVNKGRLKSSNPVSAEKQRLRNLLLGSVFTVKFKRSIFTAYSNMENVQPKTAGCHFVDEVPTVWINRLRPLHVSMVR